MTIKDKLAIKVLHLANWTNKEISEYLTIDIKDVEYMVSIITHKS